MKIGDIVRMPPTDASQHMPSGSIGLITNISRRYPHDMTQDIHDITVLGTDGLIHIWYDWQLEVICERRGFSNS